MWDEWSIDWVLLVVVGGICYDREFYGHEYNWVNYGVNNGYNNRRIE
jgi:hypothetical protein